MSAFKPHAHDCFTGAPIDLYDQLAEIEYYEKRAREARRSAKALSGDLFYLISGALVALDLVLVIWLVQR